MTELTSPVEFVARLDCTLNFVKVSCFLECFVESVLCLYALEADGECLIVSMRVFRAVEGSEDQALVVNRMCLQITERHVGEQEVY